MGDTGRVTDAPRKRYDSQGLLDVAVKVFTERGYDGTSMGDLAAIAGLSKSSLYHHVDSKEQLLRMALDRALEPLFAVLEEPGATDGPAIERLQHVVRRTVTVLTQQLPYVTLLLRVRGNTETERWALRRRREFDQHVAGLMAMAEQEGHVRDDIDPGLATRLLFGMVNSVVEWYRPPPPPGTPLAKADPMGISADDLADAVLRMVFGDLRS